MITAALGDVAEIVSGATPKTGVAGYWDGDVRWATPADLSKLDGAYIAETRRRLSEVGVRSCATTVLPTGSVLLSSRAPIGHVAINSVPMTTNQGFKSLVPGPRLDAKFLYHWLKSKTTYLQSLGNGATFKELSKKTTEQIKIPLPAITEQRRIAAILDHADALRAKPRQVLAHLDALTQSVFHDMIGDPIANSAGLPVKVLKDWIAPNRPITYGILKPGPSASDGVPYVRVADMQNRGIELRGVRRTTQAIAAEYRRSILRPGDLLMSIRGHVGRFAFVPEVLDGANITQDSARLAVNDPDAALYLRVAMESPSAQHWMARRTKGAAVKGINLGDLRELPLPMPLVGDIKRLAEVVRQVEHQREIAQSMTAPVNELISALQSEAFAGEL